MKIKTNYFVIPLVTVLIAFIGGIFSNSGMEWYRYEVIKPILTPPNWAFPVAWNIIFICAALSALIIWNKGRHPWLIGLFIVNGILNVLWSFFFFSMHEINLAFAEMLILEATIILIIATAWRVSKTASLLMLPYLLWVAFATYLTCLIVSLN